MDEKVQEFIVNKQNEEDNLTLQFAKAILSLELEIKELKEDQKEIKKDAKANGVSVGKVTKAINILKAQMKQNDMEAVEQETITEVLGADVDVKTMIAELVKKN